MTSQLCVHASNVHASNVHALGIGPSRCMWGWFPVPVSSASDEDYDDHPPLNKFCVFLCIPQNALDAPQNT